MRTIHVNASADVGNSSTKVIVFDGILKKARKQPSAMSYLPIVPSFEDEDVDTLVANLHKNIVVHITSPSIAQGGLYAIGDMANVHGGSGFNIKHHVKAEQDITIIQPIAMIATTAVQNAFIESGELPKSLNVDVEYASAIPVVDYSKANAKALEERLIGTHLLILYVGEGLQVQVNVNIKAAKVVQEGVPAFYALIAGNPSMFADYNERYGTNFSGLDFARRKMLFVDLGDGTMELIYIAEGKPMVKKSGGARVGVGHASEKAILSFKNKYRFNAELTRANFMEKVLNISDNWHNEAKNELQLMVREQEQKAFDAIVGAVENTLLNDVDDIVLFGGGTNTFIDLKKQLIEYTNKYKMRVLWIDGKESSLLNAIGLDELNNKLFFKAKVEQVIADA